jgi:predicted transcriptional regulator
MVKDPKATDGAAILGKIVGEIRREQGVSQRDLAVMAAVNRNSLRRLEDGLGATATTVARVAQVLGYELRFVHPEGRKPLGKP